MPGSGREQVVLEILAIQGRNLPNKDFFKKQDPFLQFTIGRNSHKTKVDKNGGTRPEWNHRIRFEGLFTPVNDMLKIKCLDSEWKREPQFIGDCAIDLAPVFIRGEEDGWFKLSDKGSPAGEIYLELTFYTEDGLTRRQTKIGNVATSVPFSSHPKPLPTPIPSNEANHQVASGAPSQHTPKPLPEIKPQSATHTPSSSLVTPSPINSSWSSPAPQVASSATDSGISEGSSELKTSEFSEDPVPGKASFHHSRIESQTFPVNKHQAETSGLGSDSVNEVESHHMPNLLPENGKSHALHSPPVPAQFGSSPIHSHIQPSASGGPSGGDDAQVSSIAQSLETTYLDYGNVAAPLPPNETKNHGEGNAKVSQILPPEKMTIEAILGRQSLSKVDSKLPPASTPEKPKAESTGATVQPDEGHGDPSVGMPPTSLTTSPQEISHPINRPEAADGHASMPPQQTCGDISNAPPQPTTVPLQQNTPPSAVDYTHPSHPQTGQPTLGASAVTNGHTGGNHPNQPAIPPTPAQNPSGGTAYAPIQPEGASSPTHPPTTGCAPSPYDKPYQEPAHFTPPQQVSNTPPMSSHGYTQHNPPFAYPSGSHYPTSTSSHEHLPPGAGGGYYQMPPTCSATRPEGSVYQPPPEAPYPPSSFNPRPAYQSPPPSFPVGGFAFGNMAPSHYPTAPFPNHLNYMPQHTPVPQWPAQPLPPPIPTKPQDMPMHYVHDLPPPLPSRINAPFMPPHHPPPMNRPPLPSYNPGVNQPHFPPPPSSSSPIPVYNPNNFKPSSSSSSEAKKKKKGKLGFLFS